MTEWATGTYEMGFRLGEIGLGSKRFSALLLRNHFLTLPPDPSIPRPPFERLGKDCGVILTRSHPVNGDLAPIERRDGAIRYVLSEYNRCHIDLVGDFEAYLAHFSGKTRSTLRRKVRRLLEHPHGARMRQFSTPGEMPEFHRLARSVSRLTYQESLLDAGLPDDPGYVAELVALAGRDAVRAYILTMADRPVAYLCCPVVDGVLLYNYLGYDPARADLSPGTVLQFLALEALFAERRFRTFDFTEGQGAHKRFFATHETRCADICYFPDTLGSRFWIGLHSSLDRVSRDVARVAERLGVKARLKRMLRRV